MRKVHFAMALLLIGPLLFGCGWVAVSQTRPPDPPTNIMQWWFWQVETLPALPRAIVGRLLQVLGLGLLALCVAWLVNGPIPSVARLSEPIGAVSFLILMTLAMVLRLRSAI